MDNAVYHVLHEGRRMGPYDRRTIVGMRVKKALTSNQVVVAQDGAQMTVADLVHGGLAPLPQSQEGETLTPARVGGSYSVVQGIYPATLMEVEGPGYAIPAFRGEVELRVQNKVLRVAGRYRDGREWKEERVKFPLQDIQHARLRGTVVDLWVRVAEEGGMQRVAFNLITRDAAGELAGALPHSVPYPGSEPLASLPSGGTAVHPWLWAAVVGAAFFVTMVLVWVLVRRR
ncbi:hypothetical protein WG902_17790 [Ramlibacter sp. PS3R-8]|uniref:hypothetical protein n=1 Tax=Ramlibacter sp. PS3R-8 TaxID=3133437 RepID=UPI0030B1E673